MVDDHIVSAALLKGIDPPSLNRGSFLHIKLRGTHQILYGKCVFVSGWNENSVPPMNTVFDQSGIKFKKTII